MNNTLPFPTAQPYQIAPPLSEEDFARLKNSIIERGVEVAVVVDEYGAIIDGHNRAMIADSLGIDYPKTVRTGLEPHEKRILAAELNASRRQFTLAQLVIMGKEIEPDIAERAKRRSEENLKQGGTTPSVTVVTLGEMGRTTDEVAKAVGIGSGRTYERAKDAIEVVKEEAPDLMPDLEQGKTSLPEAKKEVKRRRKQADKEHDQEVGQKMMAAIDPHDEGRWDRLQLAATRHLKNAAELCALNAESVAEVPDPVFQDFLSHQMRQLAVWWESVEGAKRRGIRAIK